MHAFYIALIAALAMFAQDVIAVPLTQAEARNRAWLSGILDTVGWLVAIATTFISVNTLAGHSLSAKVWVILLVSLANLFGSYTGTRIGKRFVKDKSVSERLEALEAVVLQRNH